MRKYVEQLKERPEHIRHNIALGVSAGVTGLVAIVWITSMAATGAFTLERSKQGLAEEGAGAPLAERTQFSELLGAVGESLGATSTEPELTVVDEGTTSTLDTSPPQNQTDQTVIPF